MARPRLADWTKRLTGAARLSLRISECTRSGQPASPAGRASTDIRSDPQRQAAGLPVRAPCAGSAASAHLSLSEDGEPGPVLLLGDLAASEGFAERVLRPRSRWPAAPPDDRGGEDD